MSGIEKHKLEELRYAYANTTVQVAATYIRNMLEAWSQWSEAMSARTNMTGKHHIEIQDGGVRWTNLILA